MGVLRPLAASLAALVAPAACYAPHLLDCTVRCSSGDDCAPGQACSAQGLCAAPGLACPAGTDGAPADAPGDAPRPDGAPRVLLHVRASAGGEVEVENAGTCDADGPQHGDCRFTVSAGLPLWVRAVPHGGYAFDRWTSTACATADLICSLTPVAAMTEVRAKFVRDETIAAGGE